MQLRMVTTEKVLSFGMHTRAKEHNWLWFRGVTRGAEISLNNRHMTPGEDKPRRCLDLDYDNNAVVEANRPDEREQTPYDEERQSRAKGSVYRTRTHQASGRERDETRLARVSSTGAMSHLSYYSHSLRPDLRQTNNLSPTAATVATSLFLFSLSPLVCPFSSYRITPSRSPVLPRHPMNTFLLQRHETRSDYLCKRQLT